jgi:type VI secretion system protein ImpH
VSLAFPESDVAAVKPRAGVSAEKGAGQSVTPQPGGGAARGAEMTVNFMGLAGASGPLPLPLTEVVIERTRKGDRAARDFLDIFNHRLVSLLYRIRKLHRVGLDTRPPGEDAFARMLFSIIGLGTPNLDARMQVKDRALLFYAGLLGQRQRSMAGLERVLSDYFGIGVRGTQSVGRWLPLEPEQWTVLGSWQTLEPERWEQWTVRGERRRAQGLGEGAVVGRRVWDQQGAFELELGPLTRAQYLDFLPTGWAFRPLCDLVRFYVGDELDFSFRLTLKAGETAETRLSGAQLGSASRLGSMRLTDATGARLGWTAWLGSGARGPETRQAVVSPRSLGAFGAGATIPSPVLPPDMLMEVERLMRMRTFEADEPVFRQGEPGDSLFVIHCGSVKVVRQLADGREVHLGTLGSGSYFGQTAAPADKARQATVTTLERCELFEISKKELEYMRAKYPRFGAYLRDLARTRQRKGRRL